MKKKLILAVLTVFAVGALSVSPVIYADGQGSPDACLDTKPNVLGSQEGTDDEVTVDVGDGNVVDGVCIKSGENMFNGNQHSGVLGNGTYEDGCYVVTGVGTQEVTVTRIGEGSNCQEISHIDVLFSKEQPPKTPVTPSTNDVLTPPKEEAQVAAPEAGVNAGSASLSSAVAPAAAFLGSLGSLAYGVIRFRKFGA